MLKERGKLVDAPEDCAETNFLSRNSAACGREALIRKQVGRILDATIVCFFPLPFQRQPGNDN